MISIRWNVVSTSFFMFICLFWYFVALKNFPHIWRRHNSRWRAAYLTNTWHSWPLNSEGSLACHTLCDMRDPFIMVISEDQMTRTCVCWAFGSGILRLRPVTARIRTANLPYNSFYYICHTNLKQEFKHHTRLLYLLINHLCMMEKINVHAKQSKVHLMVTEPRIMFTELTPNHPPPPF